MDDFSVLGIDSQQFRQYRLIGIRLMRSLTALLLVNFGVVTHCEPDILRQTGTCSLPIHISSRECPGHINLHVILMMVSVWLKLLNVCIMTEIFIYLLHVLASVSLLLVTI